MKVIYSVCEFIEEGGYTAGVYEHARPIWQKPIISDPQNLPLDKMIKVIDVCYEYRLGIA